MKKQFLKLQTLFAALLTSASVFAGAPNANVQVIHNCADPAADTVDVYISVGGGPDQILIDNFAFRTATEYVPAPSTTVIDVRVKGKNSTASDPAIASFAVGPLSPDSNYVVVASGVVGSGFAANPNSLSTAFDLKVIANSKQTAPAGFVTFAAFHGATDAPGVDVRVRGGGPLLVNNLKYGESQGWLTVPAGWYQLEVIVEDSSSVVNTWIADLSGAGGLGAVVFASGFLTPSANNNGAGFGLFAALPDGTVIELPVRRTANVQLVHNCADPAAASVDIYVNGQLGFPDLAFRGATPYIPITANFPIRVGIAPGNSTSYTDTIKTWLYFFEADTNYIAEAVGVVGSGFAANPSGISTALDIVVKQGTIITTGNPAITSFCVAHGSTDAPAVDVRVRSGGPLLVNNAPYKAVTGYISVPPTYYALEVLTADSATNYGAWIANLSSLGGQGAFVFASGFLDSTQNNNGRSFGLYAALPSGQVVEFEPRKTATVQFVHNAYDPAIDTVDVYINGAKFFANFVYKNASPALGIMTANFPINIAFAPGGSTSINDTVWQKTYFFSPGQIYIGIAQGLVGSGFAANPDGRSTTFDLLIKNPAQTQGGSGANFDFYAVHGSTDAPTVDVKVAGGPTLIQDAAYGDQTAYLSVPADNYVLQLQNAAGTTTIKEYVADVTTLGGQSGVIIASGFLDPTANGNSPYGFGLYLVTPAGGPFIALPEYNSVIDFSNEIGLKMFPNPTSGNLFINFNLAEAQQMNIEITDMNGRVVKNVMNGEVAAGNQTMTVNMSDMANGMYFARIISNDRVSNTKFTLAR